MPAYQVIINPVSGRGTGLESIPDIERLLKQFNLDYQVVLTKRPWHAAQLAELAVKDGVEVVVAVGGDGTANEVINGLMRAKVSTGKTARMGVLCVGRGNDFAFGMDIPADLGIACRLLAGESYRTIDIGKVTGGDYPQGRYFGNGVGIGFDAVVGFEALKMKRLQGFVSYLLAALKTIFLYYRAPHIQLSFDNETVQLSALMVSIMNGRRMGGGFMMAPHGLPDDGLFDLCIARQVSRLRIFQLIPHFMNGSQATQKPIRTARARRVTVTALRGSLPVHADGETICVAGNHLELEILPQQIEIFSQPVNSQP